MEELGGQVTPATNEGQESKLTLTQEELDNLIKAAKSKEEKRVSKTYEEKLKSLEKPGGKLKELSETDELKTRLEQVEAELAKRDQEQLVNQYKIELAEKGLPKEFAERFPVNASDDNAAEKILDNIKFLVGFKDSAVAEKDKRIKELEEELKNAKLRGTPPRIAQPVKSPPSTGMLAAIRQAKGK